MLTIDMHSFVSEKKESEEECLSKIHGVFNHPSEKYSYVVISGDQYVRLEAGERCFQVQMLPRN